MKYTIWGFPNEALGIRIHTDEEEIYLSTKENEKKIIQENELISVNEMKTPLPSGPKFPPLKEVPESAVIEKFRYLLWKLLYVARCVRYNICCSVNFLSRYSSIHNKTIWGYLKGIVKYLKGNNLRISYKFKQESEKYLILSYGVMHSFR